MIKLPLRLVPPTTENRTVTPTRRPNAAYRTREHLTSAEIERLLKTAGKNRWGHRDATMVLVAFRHGLLSLQMEALDDEARAAVAVFNGLSECSPCAPWDRT